MSVIDDILDDNIDQFAAQLQVVADNLKKQLLPFLAQLQMDRGVILSNDANLDIVLAFADEFSNTLQASGYTALMQEYINETSGMISQIKKASDKFPLPYKFVATDITTFQALQRIDLMELGNIGSKAATVLQTGLMNSVMAGQAYNTMYADLIAKLDNNLVRYANTYITTARSQLLQKMENMSAANRPGVNYWEYVGPEDAKNRDECIEGLAYKVFTDAEKQEFEAAYGLRYNCRHTFHAITKEEFDMLKGESSQHY